MRQNHYNYDQQNRNLLQQLRSWVPFQRNEIFAYPNQDIILRSRAIGREILLYFDFRRDLETTYFAANFLEPFLEIVGNVYESDYYSTMAGNGWRSGQIKLWQGPLIWQIEMVTEGSRHYSWIANELRNTRETSMYETPNKTRPTS